MFKGGLQALGGHVGGRLHRLPLMTRCYIWDFDIGWVWFGAVSSTFQAMADDLQCERRRGLVVFRVGGGGGGGGCERFVSGRCPEPMRPEAALELLQSHPHSTLGLVLAKGRIEDDQGCLDVEVCHLEVSPLASRKTLSRQRASLDRILRCLITKHDVAFWR